MSEGVGDSGPAVVTEGLVRSFGSTPALAGFDVAIPKGRVTALVGPNGAGKTTLLLVLTGLLAPDRGRAAVEGIDPTARPYELHRLVGWMPDFFGVYDSLTLSEYLELFGAAHGLPVPKASSRARELLRLVDLDDRSDAPVHTLSRGQKQSLGFARTLIHEPRVLLLDEPAGGLDPRARIALRDRVREQADRGVTVIISSHILAELEEMSDFVVFADRGRCRGTHPLAALLQAGGAQPWTVKALDGESLKRALSGAGIDFTVRSDDSAIVMLSGHEAAADLAEQLVHDGVRLTHLAPQAGGLQGAFMRLDEEPGK